MGICAGGGYTANAAINDRHIKAVGTVSAVNIGSMFRNRWDNNIKSADAIPVLENGSKARTAEVRGAATVTVPLAPLRKEDAPNQELEEAWEYYHTPRCQYPTAPGFATARSLNQIITYDAYNMAEVFLTQPLQIVAATLDDLGMKMPQPQVDLDAIRKQYHEAAEEESKEEKKEKKGKNSTEGFGVPVGARTLSD